MVFLIPLFIFYDMRDFKFFEDNEKDEWWNEPDVVASMNPQENVLENNILYERMIFLENQLVRIRDENTQLNIRISRLRNNLI